MDKKMLYCPTLLPVINLIPENDITRVQGEAKVRELLTQCMEIERSYVQNGYRGIIILEGWDGSGKSGIVSRLLQGFSSDVCRVWHMKKPYDHETAIHYLYRFWQKMPDPGSIVIFDRSWYGRLVADKVENIIDEERYQDAFDEINQFESLLTKDGVRISKVFLHYTLSEMQNRIGERIDRNEAYKLTINDFRTMEKYEVFYEAFDNMLSRTQGKNTKWNIIPATNRHEARVKAIRAIIVNLRRELKPPSYEFGEEVADLIQKHFPDKTDKVAEAMVKVSSPIQIDETKWDVAALLL